MSHDLVSVSWMKLAMMEQRRVAAWMEVKVDDEVGRDKAGRAKPKLHQNRHQAGSWGRGTNQTGANEPHRTPLSTSIPGGPRSVLQGKTGLDAIYCAWFQHYDTADQGGRMALFQLSASATAPPKHKLEANQFE